MKQLQELRLAFAAAKNEEEDATRKRLSAEKAYAAAKAESVGVRIGSIVTTTRQEGYGSKAKIVTRRYRVYKIDYCNYRQHELTLWGITVKKDGTDGDKHEIWQDWKVEA
jgi:hypothetical protein